MKVEIPDVVPLRDLQMTLNAALHEHGQQVPFVEMTDDEKSKFRQDTWNGQYGPAVARIGNYVIYFDGQQDQNPT